MSDEDLIEAVASGTAQALGQLYDRWGRRAHSLALRICANEALAEDVVQEAFVAVWRDPGRFDPRCGRFGAWFLTLVHHRAVDAVRREAAANRRGMQVEEVPGGVEAGAVSVDQAALEAVAAGQVRDALGQLSCPQRQALGLAYYGGYTPREIAALTGVAVGTVKSRMFTGVRRMRELLTPAQVDPPSGPADSKAADSRGWRGLR